MCSLSEASRQQNVYIGTSGSYPVYDFGIEVLRSTQITYDYTQHTSDNCIGSGQTWGSYEHHREVKCEDGWSLYGPTAQYDAYCGKPIASEERPKEQGKPPQQCPIGNPCDLGSGNKVEVQTDYQGAGALPLSFTRTYNSVDAYKNGNSTTQWQPFGDGWSATYFQRVDLSEWGGLSTVRAYRPDGRLLAFKLSGSQYLGDADVAERLTKLVDGSGNPTGWALTTSDDAVERYDLNGRLTSITTRAGLKHVLAYNGDGRVQSVTDDFGHQLTFTYTTDVAHRVATMTNPSGGVYELTYQSDGTLQTIKYPDLKQRLYHYGWASSLEGVTDEAGVRFSTFTYDFDRVKSTEHAGGVEKYSISYSGTQRTVTDPLGTVRTYDFATKVGVNVPTGITQPAASGSGTVSSSVVRDANGNATSRTDHNGRVTTYQYDLSRNLETSRTEASGTPRARTITTQWHSTFRVPTQIDEPGKRTAFTHDSSGRVLTKTVLDTATSTSRTWTYTYNSLGQVLTADGPRTDVSDVTTYTYYSCTTGYQCGQLHTVTNALSHVTTYNTYNAHGQPLTITDPNGLVTTLTYDTRQRLTSRTVGSEQTTFDYWPTGLLKKATLPDGSFLQYTYDNAHRLTQIQDSEGNRIVYTLDAMSNRTAEQLYDPSNALTQTRSRVFNTLNQLWKEIGAAGTSAVTTVFTHDNNRNQTGIDAPLSRHTSQSYDELNRLKQTTDPLSGVTQYGYNALDQLISVTDPRSKVTSYTYNALGDLTQQVSPDTGTTANTYDSGGNLATSTDARSKTATYAYDALNRVTSATYPDQTISYTYDSGSNQSGRLTQVNDASGSTSWSYDTQGRVLSRQQSMGVSKTLDYAYDSSGRLQTLTLPSGNTVTYGYADGKITSLTLNGSTTILSNVLYQPFGPTRGWTWGNSTLAIREYDADGKVTDIDSAGLKTYSYDDAFRITGIADASEPSLTRGYEYDKADRLVNVLAQAPDALGISLSATTAAPGDSVTVTVAGIPPGTGYWLALARTGVPATTYSKWIQVTPSSGGFVWNVTMPSFAGTYEVRLFSAGFNLETSSAAITVSAPPTPPQATLTVNASSVAPGGSVTVHLASGPGGSLDWLGLALVGAANTSYLQWTYVGNGVTNRDWTVTMPSTEDDYEFRLFLNDGYTLAAASGPVWVNGNAPVAGGSPTGNYTYDTNGNRLTGDGSTYTISSASNRLTSVSGALTRSYGYDNSGNVTSDGTRTFSYNDAGRMTSATKASVTTTYALSSLGQRVKKTTSGASTYFVYDEAGHLVGEYNGSGSLVQETVWFGDIPVATLRPNGSAVSLFYVHTDHLNTPRRISRPSDNVIVWRWESDPFGTTAANEDTDSDSSLFVYNMRFPGQYFDSELGLHYNYFRDFDPAVGRYVQSDPLGLRGGLNTYSYVKSNPLRYFDPKGLDTRAEPEYCFGVWCPPVRPPGGWNEEEGLKEWWEDVKDGAKNICKAITGEAARCQAIERGCKRGCTDIFADDPEGLPGVGHDYQGRWRRCVRECMEAHDCHDF